MRMRDEIARDRQGTELFVHGPSWSAGAGEQVTATRKNGGKERMARQYGDEMMINKWGVSGGLIGGREKSGRPAILRKWYWNTQTATDEHTRTVLLLYSSRPRVDVDVDARVRPAGWSNEPATCSPSRLDARWTSRSNRVGARPIAVVAAAVQPGHL